MKKELRDGVRNPFLLRHQVLMSGGHFSLMDLQTLMPEPPRGPPKRFAGKRGDDMMRLLVLSDLHGEFGTFDVPRDVGFDVAVLAGDIYQPGEMAVQWALRSDALASKQVILVPGNHEYYRVSRKSRMDRTLAAMRDAAVGTHVHILDGDELVLEGVRFLGATLWTDFALAIETPHGLQSNVELAARLVEAGLSDFRQIRTPDPNAIPGSWEERDGKVFRAQDARRIHHRQRRWLKQRLDTPFDGTTVVLTHHAPPRGSLAPWYASDWISAGFVSELPDEFFAVPALWIHGHSHASFDYRVGDCRVPLQPARVHEDVWRLRERSVRPASRCDGVVLNRGTDVPNSGTCEQSSSGIRWTVQCHTQSGGDP